jgi:capsular exopolysaccharide synthesis family protein
MSKIYEALRQAELDRATNTGNAQPNTTSQNTGQAVLDTETAAEPGFTREVRAFEPLGPSLRQASERSVGGALAEAQRPDPTPFVPAEYSSESSINSVTLDVSALQQHVWRPAVNLLPALDERGSAVEQFRSLRSRMQEFRDLNRLKTILVSSGLPQEGKSFIATNLAISFARHKAARVLLIDGDMRRATLHKLLGAPQGPGLTNYLSGDATVVQTVQRPKSDGPSKALPPGLASLAFIPSGVEHDKAADLSGSKRFADLLAAVDPYFDWIIVDSSPVNLVSDGVNLARSCDGVLLVARGGVTRYEVAQRAVAELKASKVLGVVLNAVKDPPLAAGYYGYDGYDKIEE